MIRTKKIKRIIFRLRAGGFGMRKILFLSVDMLLLSIILMLGFEMFWYVRTTASEPENAYVDFDEPTEAKAVKPEASIPKLDNYGVIWERNLFNTSSETNPVLEDKSADVKRVLAKRDMDLKLVGTVVSDNPDLNRAFFFDRRTGMLKIYRQGDRVDGRLIKNIQDAAVIISNGNNDELLALGLGEPPIISRTSSYTDQMHSSSVSFQQAFASNASLNRSNDIVLTHKEIEASLADVDTVEKWFEISPFIKGKQPMGFRVGNIVPDSIFDKMGLRYGEAITTVDGKPLTGPDQADEFFQRLKEGGEITIKVQKRRGVRRRARSIHLDIG